MAVAAMKRALLMKSERIKRQRTAHVAAPRFNMMLV